MFLISTQSNFMIIMSDQLTDGLRHHGLAYNVRLYNGMKVIR